DDMAVPQLVVERARHHVTARVSGLFERRAGLRLLHSSTQAVSHRCNQTRALGIEVRRPGGTQPRELALRELPGGGDALVAKVRRIDGAVDEFPRLPIADAAPR